MKRFAAAAVLLTMGLFVAGCENKAPAPKGGAGGAAPPAMPPNMPGPPGGAAKPDAAEGEKKEAAPAEGEKKEDAAPAEAEKKEEAAPAEGEKKEGEN